MKNVSILLIILFSSISVIFGQHATVKGKVINNETLTPIANANIIVSVNKYSTGTNNNGEFKIVNINYGTYTVKVSCIGYKNYSTELNISSDVFEAGEIKLTPTVINLGEITVTSTKFDKQLREVSIPMVAISNEEFKLKPAVTMVDLLKSEAGISLGRDGIWGTRINIRGFSKETVVTLIDGNRIETANNVAAAFSLIDPATIERIEVIKGSSSSLYGTGAIGGVVNIITNQNLFSGNYYYGGTYSSGYNSVNKGIANSLILKAGSSNWFAKISGTIRNAKDTETPAGALKDSRYKDNSIFATVGYRPFEDHEFIVSYQLFNAKDVGIPGGSAFPSTSTARYPDEKREMYSLEYKTYNLFNNLSVLDFKVFSQLINRNVEIIPNATTINHPSADHTTNGAQLQTNWIFGNYNNLIVGIDAWQREYEGIRERINLTAKKTIVDKPIPNSKYRSIGLYAQDEFKLLDNKLNLTIGGRIDQINVKNDAVSNPLYIISNGVVNNNPPKTPGASFIEGDKSDMSWSTNFSSIYKVSNMFDVTLNLGRSFRSPALEERFQYIDLGGIIYFGNPDLKPEDGYLIDLGARFWTDNFTLKANLFVNYINNYIMDQEIVNDSLYVKNNVSKARIYGFDLSWEYAFAKAFVFYGTASFSRGEDTQLKLDLQDIPPLNGRLGIKTSSLKYVSADFVANLFDSQKNGRVNLDPLKWNVHTAGYVTYDLYLNFMPINLYLANLQISAGIENITDKAYRNSLSTNRGVIKLEPGRNFFAKISLNW
ncbi:MAG: TonB-dependent receptor [bacterium]